MDENDGPFQGSVEQIRQRIMRATEKKMVALEFYQKIIESLHEPAETEIYVQDDNETVELQVGDDITICLWDNLEVDFEYTTEEVLHNIPAQISPASPHKVISVLFKVPINDDTVANTVKIIESLGFARR